MSPNEIIWRLRSIFRDSIDQYRFAFGFYPSSKVISIYNTPEFKPGFHVTDIPLGSWKNNDTNPDEKKWCQALCVRADLISKHRFSFFNLKEHDLGNPINWNRDHSSGKDAPMIYSQSIDYRDFRVTGDCKLVWEPNRHHQLVVLGRAYRATGDLRYASVVVEQIDSWLQQNPFGKGMNWRSPLELSIRLINWVWAIDLILDSGLFTGNFKTRVIHSVYLHCWDNTRKYSQGSSANNHLIGEAAGVFIASAYFREMPNAEFWRRQSQTILTNEIFSQSYKDGCTREHALGYQLFVLQFYIFSGIAARKINEDFPESYWLRIEKMLEFLGLLNEGGGNLPMFGDYDDGYVLDLGGANRDVRDLFTIGAILFNRSDFKTCSGSYRESALWLLESNSRDQFNKVSALPSGDTLGSHAFKNSGYYLLQCGERGSDQSISVFFDCADLGYKSIAAHGHADALSFTLRAFGEDILVDPGTFDYFTYPVMRNYFRSTRAHNTLTLDGKDQSEMLGLFLWGTRAQSQCLQWEPRKNGGIVVGEHDGYGRLEDPAIHRRSLDLDGQSYTLTIRDEIEAKGNHEVALYFHVSDSCSVSILEPHVCEVTTKGRKVTLEIDKKLSLETLEGSDDPVGGWVSHGYHAKAPSTTLIARGLVNGSSILQCIIKFG